MIISAFLLLFSGCERSDYNTHNELSPDSPQIVAFNYKLYEAPPKGELSHLNFEITLTDLNYLAENAVITFKSADGFTIDENPINFVFQEKTERLKVQITVTDDSKPIEIPFTGQILSKDKSDVEFFGSLLINRQ